MTILVRSCLVISLFTVLLGITACGEDTTPTSSILPVEVSFRQPPESLAVNALITVTLADVSRMDVAATVISSQNMTGQARPPYRFSLNYNPDTIIQGMNYALRARIELDGELLYTNTSSIPAFSNPPGKPVQILVDKMTQNPTVNPTTINLNSSHWSITRLEGNDSAINSAPTPSLKLQNGQVSGFSGCNNFSGSYKLNGQSLQFGPLGSTRKICPEGETMALEDRYLKMFSDVKGFTLSGQQLQLIGEDRPLAEFKTRSEDD